MRKAIYPQKDAAVVQPPNYTQIPNILIALMAEMREAELKVMLAIARETFGWHREEKLLSLTRLRALTGLSRQGVLNGIQAGLNRQLIKRRPEEGSFIYRLLVHEADQSTSLTGTPNLPDQSTPLTALVHEADQTVVHEVDTANKQRKKRPNKGEKERATRPADPLVLAFCDEYRKTYTVDVSVDYFAKPGDFVKLAALKKSQNGSLATIWPRAVQNYLRTPQASHTLADLCTRFATFQKNSLDRYNKPVYDRREENHETTNLRRLRESSDLLGIAPDRSGPDHSEVATRLLVDGS